MKPFTTTQKLVWVGVGAAMGVLAFALLSAHDWLQQAISMRQSRQESVKTLKRAQLMLYLFVLPLLIFSILLVVVIYCF